MCKSICYSIKNTQIPLIIQCLCGIFVNEILSHQFFVSIKLFVSLMTRMSKHILSFFGGEIETWQTKQN